MPEQLTLAQILDDTALLSLEHQLKLEEVVGQSAFQVDLTRALLSFPDVGVTCERVQLLGSAAPGPQSWQWGWANQQFAGEGVTALSEQVCRELQASGVVELAAPEVPFEVLGETEPYRAALVAIAATKRMSGRWTHYQCDAGAGTRVAFVIEHPLFVLPPADLARTLRVLTEGVSGGEIRDHRRAVASYARFRELPHVWAADWSQVTMELPAGRLNVAFDEYGRMTRAFTD